jgi:hypothetical protein
VGGVWADWRVMGELQPASIIAAKPKMNGYNNRLNGIDYLLDF